MHIYSIFERKPCKQQIAKMRTSHLPRWWTVVIVSPGHTDVSYSLYQIQMISTINFIFQVTVRNVLLQLYY